MEQRNLDRASLLLRVVFGGLMAVNHGYGKVAKLFWGDPTQFADVFGMGPVVSLALAAFAEFVCAILLVVGLRTRLAAIPLIVTMAVAAFWIHRADPLAERELALLYLAAYVAIYLIGPGWYALDRVIGERRGIGV